MVLLVVEVVLFVVLVVELELVAVVAVVAVAVFAAVVAVAVATCVVELVAGTVAATWTSLVGQTFTYDRRDVKFLPTEGYFIKLDQDVAGLGGDNKFLRHELHDERLAHDVRVQP